MERKTSGKEGFSLFGTIDLFQGRHRACAQRNIVFPAEFQTLDGHDIVDGLVYTKLKDKVQCWNDKNKKKPKPPHYWSDKEVTCRDWKMR